MNDSPSDYIKLTIKATASDYKILKKDYESYGLLVRNSRYMNRVSEIRNKYGVGSFEPKDNKTDTIESVLPSKHLRQEFDVDVKQLANSVQIEGNWFEGVKMHIIGFSPENYLRPESDKKIVARRHKDNLELRLYGDLTQPEIRSVLGQVKKLMTPINKKTVSKSKTKYKLSKNLAIYDLWKSGKSYKYIAKYCKDIGLSNTLDPSDVSITIRNTTKQIEKIVA